MKTIHKYGVNYGYSKLKLPLNSKFLHFAVQHGTLCAWFEVPLPLVVEPTDVRIFIVHGTGHDVHQNQKHLMSTFEEQGHLVWHLYEEVL